MCMSNFVHRSLQSSVGVSCPASIQLFVQSFMNIPLLNAHARQAEKEQLCACISFSCLQPIQSSASLQHCCGYTCVYLRMLTHHCRCDFHQCDISLNACNMKGLKHRQTLVNAMIRSCCSRTAGSIPHGCCMAVGAVARAAGSSP